MSDSATPWTAVHQASLSITNSWKLFKLMSIDLVMPSNHLILCCPFLLLPSIFPSNRVFSNESVLHIRWPKYWSFTSYMYFFPNINFFFFATGRLPLVVVSRVYSSCNAWASPCCGFSCCGAQALEHSGFSSCSY